MNETTAIQVYQQKDIDLIKTTILPKETTDPEMALFLKYCQKTGLDPFTRQIYGLRTKEKFSIMSSIDGLRLVAQRTGEYRGQTAPMWCDKDGKWYDVWIFSEPPTAAKVGVYRQNFIEPVFGVAKFDTYAQRKYDGGLQYNWSKMPDLMISKCAEALALRKAFPNELSGLYTNDEMANFTGEDKQIYHAEFDADRLKKLNTTGELLQYYKSLSKDEQEKHKDLFSLRRSEIEMNPDIKAKIENAISEPAESDLSEFIEEINNCITLEQLEDTYKDLTESGTYSFLNDKEKNKIKTAYSEIKKDLTPKGKKKNGK